ncbi:MAG: hypothetical protein ABJF01_17605 [bacterium]
MIMRAQAEDARCNYCGCTDVDPCEIPIGQLAEHELRIIGLYFRESGKPLPDTVPCWWIDVDAPVCSRPSCQAAHVAAPRIVTP